MLMIPTEQATPGMKLVMGVVNPEQPDQELLKPGFVLDPAVLKRLKGLGVPMLYIDYPDLADLDRQLMPHLSPARQTVYHHIKNTIAAVQQTAQPTVTFPDYYVATRELVLTLLEQGENPVYMDLLCGSLGDDAVNHATTVAHLSVTLGIRLEQYLVQQRSRLPARHAREVINLGVAGMLHDIGKSKLPPHLRNYDGIHPPEKEKDYADWVVHPQIGGDMLRHGLESSAVATVVQHHQHFDGSGFPALRRPHHPPETLTAQHIHVFARILLAADLYDRLAVDIKQHRRRWSIEILHLMRTQHSAWVDPQVMAVLPQVIPPFPPGSRVLLSDKTTAVVTGVKADQPYYPIVRRLSEPELKVVGAPISLEPGSDLFIRRLGDIAVEPMVRAADFASKLAAQLAKARADADPTRGRPAGNSKTARRAA